MLWIRGISRQIFYMPFIKIPCVISNAIINRDIACEQNAIIMWIWGSLDSQGIAHKTCFIVILKQSYIICTNKVG